MIKEVIKQQDVNNAAWAACENFRGVIDATGYKDYILVILFMKYISDAWKDHYEEYLNNMVMKMHVYATS